MLIDPQHHRAAYLEAARRHMQERIREAEAAGAPIHMQNILIPDPDEQQAEFYDAEYSLEKNARNECMLSYKGSRRVKPENPDDRYQKITPAQELARDELHRSLRARAWRILLGIE
jgi:hypothetical protein